MKDYKIKLCYKGDNLKYKAIADAKRELGTISDIRDTFIGFQEHLYED